jgi:hypothetical protein
MPTYEAVTPLVAYVGFTSSGDFNFASRDELEVLDGVEYVGEDFVEYMDQPLASVVQQASGIRLSLQNEDNRQLIAITRFETSKELDETEISQLKDYYDGQMSDGIGENFLSELQNRTDVQFRLEVFWLFDAAMRSQLRKVK